MPPIQPMKSRSLNARSALFVSRDKPTL
jgi:hypothetical protein